MTTPRSGNTATIITPGVPVGKARPRYTRATGRVYTPKATRTAEKAVQRAWEDAGSPWFGEQPLDAHLTLVIPRPRSHFRKNGQLNALGQRTVFCVRKPDLDNAEKLVLDALNGLAYRDDCQIVSMFAHRAWSTTGEGFTRLRLRVAP